MKIYLVRVELNTYIIMFKYLKNIFGKLSGKKNIIKLGRWDHRTTDLQKEIKIIYSNFDHCGDRICKDPMILKQNIDNIIRKH